MLTGLSAPRSQCKISASSLTRPLLTFCAQVRDRLIDGLRCWSIRSASSSAWEGDDVDEIIHDHEALSRYASQQVHGSSVSPKVARMEGTWVAW